MRIILLLLAATSFLCGCDEYQPPEPDNALRNKIFMACLEASPKGPQIQGNYSPTSVTKNEVGSFSKIIDSCESAAYYQSLPGRKTKP